MWRSFSVVFAVAVIALGFLAAPAHAHRLGYRPDAGTHVFCFGNTVGGDKPQVREAMRGAMDNLTRQTQHQSEGPNPCTDLTDVVFREGVVQFDRDARGGWACRDIDDSVRPWICRSAYVTLNRDIIARSAGPYEVNLRKTSCHEVGHSAGLDHDGDHTDPDCMDSGSVYSERRTYNRSHVDLINELRP